MLSSLQALLCLMPKTQTTSSSLQSLSAQERCAQIVGQSTSCLTGAGQVAIPRGLPVRATMQLAAMGI
jgi:hypothetical protein